MAETESLWATARALSRAAGRGEALPPLFFVTDPVRTPDPAAVAARLPQGAGVIYRAFGTADALEAATTLARIARARSLTLLVGADAELAEACGADGVHLPERALAEAPALRAKHPGWRITGAAHGAEALRAAEAAGIDAVLLSPVFPTRSSSGGVPLGRGRFAELVRSTPLPVYALGGVDARTAGGLAGTGAAGIAAVEGVISEFD